MPPNSGADEYSDGGEARAKDRILGNTDGYGLGFITSNIPRMYIQDDGYVGVGTSRPDAMLHVEWGGRCWC
jgi:hypothetical protein